MFTLEDVRNIAIQIEINGETAYRQAAEITKNSEIAKSFAMMADDEQKHAQWFEKLKAPGRALTQEEQIEKIGRDLLQGMMAQQTFSLETGTLASALNLADALRQSIEFENDTILFYEMLHGFLDDSKAMRQIELIIEEERSHIDKLNEIARFVNGQKQ